MPGLGLIGSTHFHLDTHRAFLHSHGEQVVVFPCLQCPCLLEDRQFDPNCVACKGTGRFYPPGRAYSTFLLVSQENSKREFYDPGTWTHGVIRATILPGVHLCERDKVILLDIKDTYADEVLVRGLDDTVRFRHGVSLDLIADRDIVYQPGRDYTLTPPNIVTWIAGGYAPAFGTQYSCKYSANPEFLVVNDSPRLRIENRIPQSQEVILQRLDMLSNEE